MSNAEGLKEDARKLMAFYQREDLEDLTKHLLARIALYLDRNAYAQSSYSKNNSRTRLNDDLVRALRQRWQNGASFNALSREVGVSYSAIRSAIIGITWRHVAEDQTKAEADAAATKAAA